MTGREQTPAPEKAGTSVRRVGTFTTGVLLVVYGAAMLVSLWLPRLNLVWLLRLAPLALVGLGVETLVAARKGSRVKYDWVGMLLCCLVVGVALSLTCAAWWMVHNPERFCF